MTLLVTYVIINLFSKFSKMRIPSNNQKFTHIPHQKNPP